MTTFAATQDRDGNRQVISSPLPFFAKKVMTFAGGTTNDPGDYNGTGNPATLFTVTGEVLIKLFAICQVPLEGTSATIEVGDNSATTNYIAQTTATDITDGMAWLDATPADTPLETIDLGSPLISPGGNDVIQTVGTANITAGQLTYYCFWRPLSSDGNVVAA